VSLGKDVLYLCGFNGVLVAVEEWNPEDLKEGLGLGKAWRDVFRLNIVQTFEVFLNKG